MVPPVRTARRKVYTAFQPHLLYLGYEYFIGRCKSAELLCAWMKARGEDEESAWVRWGGWEDVSWERLAPLFFIKTFISQRICSYLSLCKTPLCILVAQPVKSFFFFSLFELFKFVQTLLNPIRAENVEPFHTFKANFWWPFLLVYPFFSMLLLESPGTVLVNSVWVNRTGVQQGALWGNSEEAN